MSIFFHCHNKAIKINSSILTYLSPVIELIAIAFSGPNWNQIYITDGITDVWQILWYENSNNNNVKSVRAHGKKCIQSKFYRNTMNFKFMCIIVCFHFHRNQMKKNIDLPWSMNAISVVKTDFERKEEKIMLAHVQKHWLLMSTTSGFSAKN